MKDRLSQSTAKKVAKTLLPTAKCQIRATLIHDLHGFDAGTPIPDLVVHQTRHIEGAQAYSEALVSGFSTHCETLQEFDTLFEYSPVDQHHVARVFGQSDAAYSVDKQSR